MRLQKFGQIVDGEERKFSYPGVWARQQTSCPDRLIVAPAAGHVAIIRDLVSILKGPFWLLYVLQVGRGGGEPGRYQVPEPLTGDDVGVFLDTFRDFLEEDGRHELWVASSVSDAQIIYDNHNVLYLYGPLESFIQRLGLSLIAHVDRVDFPFPHYHHYWAAHDSSEAALLGTYEWIFSPTSDRLD